MTRHELARLALTLAAAAAAGALAGLLWIFTKPEPWPEKRPPLWMLDGTLAADE